MSPMPTVSATGIPPLAHWDARLRLVALLLLAFAFSAATQLRAVPLMLGITTVFWLLSRLPLGNLLRRLRYPSILVLCMALALLLRRSPNTLFHVGSFGISQEGAQAAALLLTRFYCILTLAFAFLSISPLLHIIEALRALRVPFIMVDMALLMARYLEVLKQDLHNMKLATQLRGFRSTGWSMHTVKTQSWLAASLLLRSYERADGIYKAMRLRGYGQKAGLRHPPLTHRDWLFFAITVLLAATIFWLG
jgi:cobalt/nickel transport system permease protein